MLTANDIKVMKEIFVTKADLVQFKNEFKTELKAELRNEFATKNDLKKELTRYSTKEDLENTYDKLESLIISEVRTLIDMIGDSMAETREYASEFKINYAVVRDHERRIQYLEEKKT